MRTSFKTDLEAIRKRARENRKDGEGVSIIEHARHLLVRGAEEPAAYAV